MTSTELRGSYRMLENGGRKPDAATVRCQPVGRQLAVASWRKRSRIVVVSAASRSSHLEKLTLDWARTQSRQIGNAD